MIVRRWVHGCFLPYYSICSPLFSFFFPILSLRLPFKTYSYYKFFALYLFISFNLFFFFFFITNFNNPFYRTKSCPLFKKKILLNSSFLFWCQLDLLRVIIPPWIPRRGINRYKHKSRDLYSLSLFPFFVKDVRLKCAAIGNSSCVFFVKLFYMLKIFFF